PHLFSYLFLLLTMVLLERFARSDRFFEPLLPLVCVLWANLHGVEYPVALAALALYCGAGLAPYLQCDLATLLRTPRAARWPVLFAACALSFAVNPFGARLLATPAIAAQAEVMGQIAEMVPVPWRSLGNLYPGLELWSPVWFSYSVVAGFLLGGTWLRRREGL